VSDAVVRSPDVVIVGAGLAGAATAFFLARERGLRISACSNGRRRRAPTARAATPARAARLGDPALDALCDEGAAFIAAPPDDFPGDPKFRRTGSFLLVTPEQARGWKRARMEIVAPRRGRARRPALSSADRRRGAAHRGRRRRRRARAARRLRRRRTRARRRRADGGSGARELVVAAGRVAGVATSAGTLGCGVVVDAAGAWASALARGAGAGAAELVPRRRHLLVTAPDARASTPPGRGSGTR
jgi:glycine/D-amino acid oxidase-like deaminating enzyme